MSEQEMFDADEDKSSDEEDPVEDGDTVEFEELQKLFKKQYNQVFSESVSLKKSYILYADLSSGKELRSLVSCKY